MPPPEQQAKMTPAQIAAYTKGNAVVVTAGRYCIFGEGCIIRPPYKTYKGWGK